MIGREDFELDPALWRAQMYPNDALMSLVGLLPHCTASTTTSTSLWHEIVAIGLRYSCIAGWAHPLEMSAPGIDLLQRAFVVLTGEKTTLAVVISTLVIAALFNPLRRRIQSFIDRSLYRMKYDAAKTLEGFLMKLREETDLDALKLYLLPSRQRHQGSGVATSSRSPGQNSW